MPMFRMLKKEIFGDAALAGVPGFGPSRGLQGERQCIDKEHADLWNLRRHQGRPSLIRSDLEINEQGHFKLQRRSSQ
jgi:hypothetical protein